VTIQWDELALCYGGVCEANWVPVQIKLLAGAWGRGRRTLPGQLRIVRPERFGLELHVKITSLAAYSLAAHHFGSFRRMPRAQIPIPPLQDDALAGPRQTDGCLRRGCFWGTQGVFEP